MNQKTKQILIIIVIVVVSFIGYKIFFVNKEPAGIALAPDSMAMAELADNQKTLTLLNNLKRVTLDEMIFSNQIFMELINFERPIMDEPIGRPNPFLPIGR